MTSRPLPDLELITSAANPTLKMLRALDRKKTRNENNLFLVEGARHLREALDRGWEIALLTTSEDGLARDTTRTLIADAMAKGARGLQVSPRLLSQIARKDNPQALVGAVRPRMTGLEAAIDQAGRTVLALFEVRDPGNLGTLMRTADCAGLSTILLLGDCCDPFSVEAVRASMGSLFPLTLATATPDSGLQALSKAGFETVAASINGTGSHTELAWPGRAAILMGNEQAGLPSDVEARCDHLVRIPMRPGADSLNLANAGALMIYENWRQKGFSHDPS